MAHGVLHLRDRRVLRVSLEARELLRVQASDCEFHGLQLVGVTVRAGVLERCTFRHCVIDRSKLTVEFRRCRFEGCHFRGITGAKFLDCRGRSTRLLEMTDCTFEGGWLHRCVYGDELDLSGVRKDYCESFASAQLIEDSARVRKQEPYAETDTQPRRRREGAIIRQGQGRSKGRVGGSFGSRPGAVKAALRELRATRERLPPYPYEVRAALRRCLRRPKVFGLSEPARKVLDLLVSVDQTVTGLVWPTVSWLSQRSGLPPGDIVGAMRELGDRGWLSRWLHTTDATAAWVDYEFVQRHIGARSPMSAAERPRRRS
ncbi:MAG: hypothetical protein AAF799_36700 [Myxococcota bacterium]